MRPTRFGTLAVLVFFLLVSLPGCAVTSPEWGYFDTDRHPTGAYPAQAGYYGGAYVVYPVTVFLGAVLMALGGGGYTGGGELEGGAHVFGVGFGLVLGAPFHLIGLCVDGGGEANDAPEPLPEPE